MSSYYDQPALRQRGPEDVAGVLVLLACAVLAFAWYPKEVAKVIEDAAAGKK